MRLGVALPIVDIGGEPAALREFAQAAEEIGYHGIAAPDHVLGANVASRPGWTQPRARSTDFYHDPFCALRLSRRLHQDRRFLDPGVDPGPASNRAGRASKPPVSTSCRAGGSGSASGSAGTKSSLSGSGEFPQSWPPLRRAGRGHAGAVWRSRTSPSRANGTIEMPASARGPSGRKIPLWYGGHADVTLRRCAKWGDGWMPSPIRLAKKRGPPSPPARHAEEAGRDSGDDRHRHPVSPARATRPTGAIRCSSGNRSGDPPDFGQLLRKRPPAPHRRPVSERSHRRDARHWNAVADLL